MTGGSWPKPAFGAGMAKPFR